MSNEFKIELPEVVNKALDKPATTLGEKISDLLEIIFGGITYKKQELAYKRELNYLKFKKELSEKLNGIPDEDKVEPKESVLGPILEAAKYRIDTDEVRRMFVNLIASSVDKKTADTVHPGFIEVIKNLSADDALALQLLSLGRNGAICMIISANENELRIPNNTTHHCVLTGFFGFEESNLIISSLARNELIEIKYIFNEDTEIWGSNFNKLKAEFAKFRHEEIGKAKNYRYGTLSLTPFGYEFAKVCSPLQYSDLGIEEYMRTKQQEKWNQAKRTDHTN